MKTAIVVCDVDGQFEARLWMDDHSRKLDVEISTDWDGINKISAVRKLKKFLDEVEHQWKAK